MDESNELTSDTKINENDDEKCTNDASTRKSKSMRRTRSASAGRNTDLRAQYWGTLFKNLHYAIGELYVFCERDESISACQEVIMVLENHIRDFNNLAEWFRVDSEYERTPAPQRPKSLAWDIRKSSSKPPPLTASWKSNLEMHGVNIDLNDLESRKTRSASQCSKLASIPPSVEAIDEKSESKHSPSTLENESEVTASSTWTDVSKIPEFKVSKNNSFNETISSPMGDIKSTNARDTGEIPPSKMIKLPQKHFCEIHGYTDINKDNKIERNIYKSKITLNDKTRVNQNNTTFNLMPNRIAQRLIDSESSSDTFGANNLNKSLVNREPELGKIKIQNSIDNASLNDSNESNRDDIPSSEVILACDEVSQSSENLELEVCEKTSHISDEKIVAQICSEENARPKKLEIGESEVVEEAQTYLGANSISEISLPEAQVSSETPLFSEEEIAGKGDISDPSHVVKPSCTESSTELLKENDVLRDPTPEELHASSKSPTLSVSEERSDTTHEPIPTTAANENEALRYPIPETQPNSIETTPQQVPPTSPKSTPPPSPKPIPGQNVAAPVFVPGKRVEIITRPVMKNYSRSPHMNLMATASGFYLTGSQHLLRGATPMVTNGSPMRHNGGKIIRPNQPEWNVPAVSHAIRICETKVENQASNCVVEHSCSPRNLENIGDSHKRPPTIIECEEMGESSSSDNREIAMEKITPNSSGDNRNSSKNSEKLSTPVNDKNVAKKLLCKNPHDIVQQDKANVRTNEANKVETAQNRFSNVSAKVDTNLPNRGGVHAKTTKKSNSNIQSSLVLDKSQPNANKTKVSIKEKVNGEVVEKDIEKDEEFNSKINSHSDDRTNDKIVYVENKNSTSTENDYATREHIVTAEKKEINSRKSSSTRNRENIEPTNEKIIGVSERKDLRTAKTISQKIPINEPLKTLATSQVKSMKPGVLNNVPTRKNTSDNSILSTRAPNASATFRSNLSTDVRSNQKCNGIEKQKDKTQIAKNDANTKQKRVIKDKDGWETVISRSRRSVPNVLDSAENKMKFNVKTRFHQPTPCTSLPTLAISGGECGERSKVKLGNAITSNDRNRFEVPKMNGKLGSSEEEVPKKIKNSVANGSDKNSFSSAKNLDRNAPSRVKNADKRSPKIENVSDKNSTLKKASADKKNSQCKAIRNSSRTKSQTDSNDSFDSEEESFRKSEELYQEEMSLQKEIRALESDGVEEESVDFELKALCNGMDHSSDERRVILEKKYNHLLSSMSWADQIETLDKLELLMLNDPSGRSLSYALRFTSMEQIDDLVARDPGRVVQLHQKLSSPSRKCNPEEQKERMEKAQKYREQMRLEKSAKLKELLNRVNEVKLQQDSLKEGRRQMIEQKLEKAEKNRNLHLKNIQEKAHDESKKLEEIAFITKLEREYERDDLVAFCMSKEDETSMNLNEINEKRHLKQEEKAAKEAAAEERRKVMEAERQERMEELQAKRKQRDERIDQEFQKKEQDRQKLAREKAKEREDRMQALQAAQIANTEELQKKIQQKHEESARRYEENIESIRQRAVEFGTLRSEEPPRLKPYLVDKLCTVCDILIDSEVFLVSHLKGRAHQEAMKKYKVELCSDPTAQLDNEIIKDASDEALRNKKTKEMDRRRAFKKRCKKLKQRLFTRSAEYALKLYEMEQAKDKVKIRDATKLKIMKSIKEVERLINSQENGDWSNSSVTALERNLFEIIKAFKRQDVSDQEIFRKHGGFEAVANILKIRLDGPSRLPDKCFMTASALCTSACENNAKNSIYMMMSHNLVPVIELLVCRLNQTLLDVSGSSIHKYDNLASSLMNVISLVTDLSVTYVGEPAAKVEGIQNMDEVFAHLNETVSYIVCLGIVDKLSSCCANIRDNKLVDCNFIGNCMTFLSSLAQTSKASGASEENASLLTCLRVTELVGSVSMLYAMLLQEDAPILPYTLISDVKNVVIATLGLFLKLAQYNIQFFQEALGAEGISLQIRHICSYLIKCCIQNGDTYNQLLHPLIQVIGYFVVYNRDNQMIIQSGSNPTVLQQLSNLPFSYFSNPALTKVLFPTLLACCVDNPENKAILDQEMSYQLLDDFLKSADSQNIPLIKLLRKKMNSSESK